MSLHPAAPAGSHACAFVPLGLALFTSWISFAFYSQTFWTRGSMGVLAEWPVVVSMLTAGAVSAAVIVLARFLPQRPLGGMGGSPWLAAGLCAAGSFVLPMVGSSGSSGSFVTTTGTAACVVMAVGFALHTVQWGGTLSRLDEARIELYAPVAFALGQCFTWVIGLLPVEVTRMAAICLPLASAALMTCAKRPKAAGEGGGESRFADRSAGCGGPQGTVPGVGEGLSEVRNRLSFAGALAAAGALFLCRFLYGLVRIPVRDAEPEGVSGFVSLLLALAVFGAFALMALRTSRRVDVGMAVVWVLPLLLMAMALLVVGGSACVYAAAVLNRVASLGMQAFWWIVLAKAARRDVGGSPALFACYLLGLGPGVAGGIVCAELGMEVLGDAAPAVGMVVACALTMPLLMLSRQAERLGEVPKSDMPVVCGVASPPADFEKLTVIEVAEVRARELARLGGLTERERDVLVYLLAGYNRPYIRDHLHISLNTVGSHAKSIFVKLDVHSQQELMDLAARPLD